MENPFRRRQQDGSIKLIHPLGVKRNIVLSREMSQNKQPIGRI